MAAPKPEILQNGVRLARQGATLLELIEKSGEHQTLRATGEERTA
jgi:hypothetical protein